MKKLFNIQDKLILRKKLSEESFKRTTCSFYKYFNIKNLESFRDHIYIVCSNLGILGRIYVANEGINAQISIPNNNLRKLKKHLNEINELKNIKIKIGVEDDGKSFEKLIVRIKSKIVADGLRIHNFDPTKVGKYLSPKKFNQTMEEKDSIVVDVRNHYETEVGLFEGGISPNTDTFRESLPEIKKILKGKEKNKILLYCTGGIRCEKASAYLKHHGFQDVNQLEGGIIEYAHQVKQKKIRSKFKGKNFVFDKRLGEKVTEDIISNCHQCYKPSNSHTDCAFQPCHKLFIQCKSCSIKYNGCCSKKCYEFSKLPKEEIYEIKGQINNDKSVTQNKLKKTII